MSDVRKRLDKLAEIKTPAKQAARQSVSTRQRLDALSKMKAPANGVGSRWTSPAKQTGEQRRTVRIGGKDVPVSPSYVADTKISAPRKVAAPTNTNIGALREQEYGGGDAGRKAAAPASNYLRGAAETMVQNSYAAAKSAPPVKRFTAPWIGNTQRTIERARELVSAPALEGTDKSEAKELQKALNTLAQNEVQPWKKDKKQGFTLDQLSEVMNLRDSLQRKTSVLGAFSGGLMNEASFGTASRGIGGTPEQKAQVQNAFAEMQQGNPGAFNVGAMTGTLARYLALNELTGMAIKGTGTLAQTGRSALTFGTDSGITSAVQMPTKEEWDAAEAAKLKLAAETGRAYTAQPYDRAEQWLKVARKTGTGALGGAAGALASRAVGATGEGILKSLGVQGKLPEIARQTVAGTAFAVGNTAVTYPLTPQDERPTKEQIAQNLAVMTLFSAISSTINTLQTSKANAEFLQRGTAEMQKEYQNILSGAYTTEQKAEALGKILSYNDSLKSALEQNRYVGQQKTVNELRTGIDNLSAWARGQLAGMGGAASGPSASTAAGAMPTAGVDLSDIGTNGTRNLNTLIKANSTPDFTAQWKQFYEAGRASLPMERVPEYPTETPIARAAAYGAWSAGQNDRAAAQSLSQTAESVIMKETQADKSPAEGAINHAGQQEETGARGILDDAAVYAGRTDRNDHPQETNAGGRSPAGGASQTLGSRAGSEKEGERSVKRQVGKHAFSYQSALDSAVSEDVLTIRQEFSDYGIDAEVFDGYSGVEMDGEKIDTQGGAITLEDGSVLLDSTTIQPDRLKQIRRHETVHAARRKQPALYISAFNTIEDIGVNMDTDSDIFDRIAEGYQKIHPGEVADTDKILEETLAQIAGWELADPDFAKERFHDLFYDYDAVIDALHELDEGMKRATAMGRAETGTSNRDIRPPAETKSHQADRGETDQRWTTTRSGNAEQKPKGIAEIVERLRHDFGLPITAGNVRGKGVRGLYAVKAETIRTKEANNLPTIAHELGHHLDKKYGLTKGLPKELAQELLSGMEPAFRNQYKPNQQVGEGLAEFVRKYLQNHETTAIDYPQFAPYFRDALSKDTLALVDRYADEMNAYYALDAHTAASSISMRGDKADFRSARERANDHKDRLYQAFIDSNHGIHRFAEFTGDKTPYVLATNSAYVDSIAYSVVTGDLTDANGKRVGDGLSTALHGVDLRNDKEYRAFGEYLVVRHGPERLKEGMRIFADDRKNSSQWMEGRTATLEREYPDFPAAADRLYQFQRQLLQTWGVQSGLISKEQFQEWGERWKNYVPFNRAVPKQGGGVRRGFANQTSTIKRAKGSGLDIVHPVDNIVNNAVRMVTAAVRNNVMRSITEAAGRVDGAGAFLEKVPMPLRPKKFDAKNMKDKLRTAAVEAFGETADETIDAVFTLIDTNIDDVLTQFGAGKAFGDTVTVLVQGKPQYWKIHDPLLLESITNMAPGRISAVLSAYGRVTRLITGNITGNNLIWSIFSNLPRDLMTFYTYSDNKNPLKLIGGIASSYVNKAKAGLNRETDPLYQEYVALGGGHVSAYTADKDRAQQITKTLHGKGAWETYNPLAAVEFASDMIEAGPRFAYYRLLRQQGNNPQSAFYAAQDVTTNFKRGGSVSREINKVVPFFNASVQGLDRFARFLSGEDAPAASRKKAVTSRWAMFLTASIAMGALMALINGHDDEAQKDYAQLSSYTKNNYWNIPLGDGQYFAIPKPREIAVLSSGMERAIELFLMDNEDAFHDFYDYAADQLLPPVLTEVAKADPYGALGNFGLIGTIAYMMANRDFRGNPIVSRGLEGLEPRAQFDQRTSKLAFQIGQALDVSPKMVDYFFQNTLGGIQKINQALFPIGDENRDWTLGVKNTYLKDNRYSTDVINSFYDEKERVSRAAKTDPENMALKVRNKEYSSLGSFYSRYAALSKGQADTAQRRSTRQTVIDMIEQFTKEEQTGNDSAVHAALVALAEETGSTELFPQVMDVTIKVEDDPATTNDESTVFTMSDRQYVEFQTDYLRRYWEGAEQALRSGSTEEKTKALRKAKAEAVDTAKAAALKRLGATVKQPFSSFKKQFDLDGNGSYTKSELQSALDTAGWLSDSEKKELFQKSFPKSINPYQ